MISSDHTVISDTQYKLLQNIRSLRELKGWTQDTMATLLDMSEKAYASIEQGKTDIQWSRLEQIANLLEVELADLVNLDRGMIFNFITHNSHQTATYNNQSSVNSSSTTSQQLEHELEKARLVIEAKDKEIAYLKEIIELRKKATVAN
jgi:transcriptional regulator with XRE-family HTH domain